ncbi:hypothetical protein Xoosp13_168 [Xanthomonas phage Xoo-sp13]|nr:hypothetical protein Xoosp13_168 [Xanthomonas phage Xoo-sp13]
MAKFFETWPKYVKVLGHHDTSVYLANDKDQFIEIMISTALQWLADGDFGEEAWYDHGTYYDYFKKKMGGMSEEFFTTNILPLTNDNHNIDELKKQGRSLKDLYRKDKIALSELKFVKQLSIGERPKGYINFLYHTLTEHTLDYSPRFVVSNFDN